MAEAQEVVKLDQILYGVLERSDGSATPINATPDVTFDQVRVIGDTSQVSDHRLPAIILSDMRDGMGEERYAETEGITTYQYSSLDTRFNGALVLPPETIQLGSQFALGGQTAPWRITYLGQPTASIVAWKQAGQSYRYDPSGNVWYPLFGTTYGFSQFAGKFIVGYFDGANATLASSTNGATWTPLAGSGGLTVCATHDNKLYAFDANRADVPLSFTTDLVNWTRTPQGIVEYPGESALQLLEWRDHGGRKAIYALTNRRLVGLDDETLTFWTYRDLTAHNPSGGAVGAHVWQRNDNLYLSFHNPGGQHNADSVLEFTGSAINQVGPNKRGGYPKGLLFTFTHLVGGLHWLYGWGGPRAGSGAFGRTVAMNDRGGWHTLLDNPLPDGAYVIGGGAALGKVWTITSGGTVYEQDVPDTSDNPQQAIGRRYRTGVTRNHRYALTDGGTPNIPKNLRHIRIDARKPDGLPGIPVGTTVYVNQYPDGGGDPAAYVTLTPTSLWPAIVKPPVGDAGQPFREVAVEIGLVSTVPTSTPAILSVAPHYVRKPAVRYSYGFTLDLRGGRGLAGRSAAELRQLLFALARSTYCFSFSYGGGPTGNGPNLTTVPAVEFAMAPQEDPEYGAGVYRCTVRDVTAPVSGA